MKDMNLHVHVLIALPVLPNSVVLITQPKVVKLGVTKNAHVAVAGSTKNAIQDEYGFDKNSIEFKLDTKADLMYSDALYGCGNGMICADR